MFDFMLWTGVILLAIALAALLTSVLWRTPQGKPRRDLQIGALWMGVSGIAVLGLYALEIAGVG